MTEESIRACLVSPFPPPYGGISHWTSMILRHTENHRDISAQIVNTAPRWRHLCDFRPWKRIMGGTLQFVRDILRLTIVLIFHRPHVIHLTTAGRLGTFRDIGVVTLARFLGVPTINHIRFGRVPMIAKRRTEEWKRLAYVMRKAHSVIVIDTPTRDAIKDSLPNIRLIQIPNCVDPEDLPSPEKLCNASNEIIYIGWVVPTKGIAELIEAWTTIDSQDATLSIIGPGDDEYKDHLISTYHPKGVHFAGELPHDDAMAALSHARALVLPSHTEGFPNVVAEGMALGRPIIATRVGAIPDMLGNGAGLLVDAHDVNGLAEAISAVIQNRELRCSLGRRAFQRALTEYQISTVVHRLLVAWRHAASDKITVARPRRINQK